MSFRRIVYCLPSVGFAIYFPVDFVNYLCCYRAFHLVHVTERHHPSGFSDNFVVVFLTADLSVDRYIRMLNASGTDRTCQALNDRSFVPCVTVDQLNQKIRRSYPELVTALESPGAFEGEPPKLDIPPLTASRHPGARRRYYINAAGSR